MNTVYLSLGSNLGDRAADIAQAIAALDAHGVRVTKQSSLYETEAVNVRGSGSFLNAAVRAETDSTPQQLMRTLLAIERSLGRVRPPESPTDRRELKEPRTIDLDILLFGTSIIDTPELTIPHARMAERRFVLAPLAEIAPEIVHPVLDRTIADLLVATSDRSQVALWSGDGPK
jgi:2-amino-4-hydroxy-6-hydroxymethyldihydropteridine diphosphokinase